MKTIIKITKQEAIDAWKDMNSHIVVGEDTTVEIEDMSIGTGSFTSTTSTGIGTYCIGCGEYIPYGSTHAACRGYKTTC